MKASVGVNTVHARFKKKAEFLLVYLREAHPSDGWAVRGWSKVADPTSKRERDRVARRCCKEASFRFTALVDTMEDETAVKWAAWPERLFVVGKDGRVVYAGKQGPWGFWPTDKLKRGQRRVGRGESLEAFLDGYFGPKKSQESD